MPNEDLRNLIDRIEKIEVFMANGELQRTKVNDVMMDVRTALKEINTRLNGDYVVYPPILGHEQRIINLEKVEGERIKNKDWAIKTATGALTIAVGGAVIWLFNVIKDAFTRGGH